MDVSCHFETDKTTMDINTESSIEPLPLISNDHIYSVKDEQLLKIVHPMNGILAPSVAMETHSISAEATTTESMHAAGDSIFKSNFENENNCEDTYHDKNNVYKAALNLKNLVNEENRATIDVPMSPDTGRVSSPLSTGDSTDTRRINTSDTMDKIMTQYITTAESSPDECKSEDILPRTTLSGEYPNNNPMKSLVVTIEKESKSDDDNDKSNVSSVIPPIAYNTRLADNYIESKNEMLETVNSTAAEITNASSQSSCQDHSGTVPDGTEVFPQSTAKEHSDIAPDYIKAFPQATTHEHADIAPDYIKAFPQSTTHEHADTAPDGIKAFPQSTTHEHADIAPDYIKAFPQATTHEHADIAPDYIKAFPQSTTHEHADTAPDGIKAFPQSTTHEHADTAPDYIKAFPQSTTHEHADTSPDYIKASQSTTHEHADTAPDGIKAFPQATTNEHADTVLDSIKASQSTTHEHADTASDGTMAVPQSSAQDHLDTAPDGTKAFLQSPIHEHADTALDGTMAVPQSSSQDHADTASDGTMAVPQSSAQDHLDTARDGTKAFLQSPIHEHADTALDGTMAIPQSSSQDHLDTSPDGTMAVPQSSAQDHLDTSPDGTMAFPQSTTHEHADAFLPRDAANLTKMVKAEQILGVDMDTDDPSEPPNEVTVKFRMKGSQIVRSAVTGKGIWEVSPNLESTVVPLLYTLTKINSDESTAKLPPLILPKPGYCKRFNTITNINDIRKLLVRKNVIANYQPIKSTHIKHLFACMYCSDTFTNASTFTMHVQRPSMTIYYYCKKCALELCFYNKCSLWLHLRRHDVQGHKIGVRESQIAANIVCISLLPPTSQTFTLFSEAEQKACMNPLACLKQTEVLGRFDCTECHCIFSNAEELAVHFGSLEIMCSFAYSCGRCDMNLPRPCALSAHRRLHTMSGPMVCPECGKLFVGLKKEFDDHLTNVCMHRSRTIQVKCSKLKCGEVFKKICDLKYHCLTKHSTTYFKCKMCPMAFKTQPSAVNHLCGVHDVYSNGVTLVLKCALCDSSAINEKLMQLHLEAHMLKLKKNLSYFYQCLYCCIYFSMKHKLFDHIQTCSTAKKSICGVCKSAFQTDSELTKHLEKDHDVMLQADDKGNSSAGLYCTPCKKTFSSFADLDTHMAYEHMLNEGLHQCGICRVGYPELVYLQKHIVEQHSNSPFVCPCCKARFHCKRGIVGHMQFVKIYDRPVAFACKKATYNSGLQSELELIPSAADGYNEMKIKEEPITNHNDIRALKGREPKPMTTMLDLDNRSKSGPNDWHSCHLCGLLFKSTQSLDEHVMLTHEGQRRILQCYLCKKRNMNRTFANKALISKHFNMKHRIGDSKIIDSLTIHVLPENKDDDFEEIMNSSPTNKSNLKVDSPPHTEMEKTETLHLKTVHDDKFTCAKCLFSTVEKSEFCTHILLHKQESDALQCPDCGVCFVVWPSLKKHLFIVHRVTDFSPYAHIEAREGDNAEVDDSLDPSGNPLKCRVCSEVFETEAAHKSHMRTHGMAFIRSKRVKLSRD